LEHLVLAPAERADVIADFRHSAGQTHYVTNTTPREPLSTPAPPLTAVMQIRVGTMVIQPGPAAVPASLPGRRAKLPAPHRRRFITLNEVAPETADWTLNLNGRDFENSPPTERPKAGTVEDWVFINMTGDTHPMHTHLVTHQVVGRTPFDAEAYQAKFGGPHGVPGGIRSAGRLRNALLPTMASNSGSPPPVSACELSTTMPPARWHTLPRQICACCPLWVNRRSPAVTRAAGSPPAGHPQRMMGEA
jgi:hypothetical protein